MKKYIILLYITLSASFCLAQTKTEIGIKAGLSIPNLTSGSSANPVSNGYTSRLDGDAAIHAEFHIGKSFSIQPQLEYSSQGGKKNGMQAFTPPDEILQQFPAGQAPTYLYAEYKSIAKINYLMLPVLAKYYFNLKKKWGAYFAGGPFISYLLNAKNITKGSSIVYLDPKKTQPLSSQMLSFDSKDNVTSDLHRFNAGISGHLGVDYKVAGGSLFIEAGGNYGFIDIQKNNLDGKNKTGAAVINLGYQFKL
ncbi:MAG: PorT family protein [Sphingobacteriales bacterium]|nr:PorT family protein [Sphingobacteriales bacterium]OJW34100.1 MAG: hypothetical protein BGO54_05375 [Sphingobacteriales bacterium 46-32]